ncbi:MAG: Dabb family protein [Simkania sp.]|nr:Dabb family protein [Simkania sp.]
MIRHIVLYKIRKEVPQEKIAAIFTKLISLKNLVKGIKEFHWGPYCGSSDKNFGYNYAITVDLVNESVFAEYSPHPVHNAVREEMATILEATAPLLMFDFEMP